MRIKVNTSAENVLSTLDNFVLKEGSILDQLVFHLSAEDLVYRAVFMTTFVVLALSIFRVLSKSRKLDKELLQNIISYVNALRLWR